MTAFPHLQNQQYMSLTTFRKNGDPVPTPVWFAQVGDKLYVYSEANAGKLKRLQHTQRVTVAPCTMSGTVTGEAQEAVARILNADEGKIALDAINRKYGWQTRVLGILSSILEFITRRKSPDEVYLEIIEA
jgi:PPOX class probable F420-dependent enzyme